MKAQPSDQLLYRQFGRILAELRRKKHVSQEVLADELGLSRTSVTNIEKGRQPVQLHSLYRIARVLGVEIKELLPSPGLLESPRTSEQLSVSRSEWLEAMNVRVPKGLSNAPKRHRTRSPRTA